MKRFFLLLSIVLLFQTLTVLAQKPKAKTAPKKKPAEVKPVFDEKEEFEKAIAIATAPERIAALEKFLKEFPNSENKDRALELIVSARAEIGEEKLRFSENEAGVSMFKLAAQEAPKPMSDELFTKVVIQFPTNLFFRGQKIGALEVAKIIEEKSDGNAQQLLGLATFYLGIENGDEAKRLAEKAIAIDPNLPAAYQTLGLANRLNFDLENSVNAYAKALELDANSVVSKRSLAEMKRAVGKPAEAAALYREILEKDASDAAAQTGLVLSLFDADKQTEAETELAKSLEANPNNLLLLVGTAYWYAAHNQNFKAAEYAQKAVDIEPRYTWAHIALARALLGQNKPADAEKTLLAARQYGNFPTLDYELASVRAAAGFYNEAAQELKKSFIVTKDGSVRTRLGYRVPKEAANFTELLAAERRASIFQPLAADSAENAERLKNLLNFAQKIDAKDATETEIDEAVDNFVKGEDKAKTYRQIYAANRLLQKKIALPKSLELVQSAMGGVDASLEIDSPTSFVLADELYESRTAAIAKGQLVLVPEVARPTLSNIIRGRIEEIAGWTLYQQEKPEEAVVRLKRAVGILPEKSAWWRSSLWRLGASLEAAGKDSEALDAYIKSYVSGEADAVQRSVIETLYKRLNNGTLDGLDKRLEAKPQRQASFLIKQPEIEVAKTEASTSPQPEGKASVVITENSPLIKAKNTSNSSPLPETKTEVSETPQLKPEISPSVKASPLPQQTTPEKIEPSPQIEPSPTAETSPSPAEIRDEAPKTETSATPVVTPAPSPAPEDSPQPADDSTTEEKSSPGVETTPEPSPTTSTEPTPVETKPSPAVEPTVEPTPETKIEPTPESNPSTKVETTPTPETRDETESTPTPTPEIKTEPAPTPTPEIKTESVSTPTSEKKPANIPASKLEVVVTENIPAGTIAQNKPQKIPPTKISPTPEPSPTEVEFNPEPTPSPTVENTPTTEKKTEPTDPNFTPENKTEPKSKVEVIVTENASKPSKTGKVANIPPNPPTKSKSIFEPVVINPPANESVQPKPEQSPQKTPEIAEPDNSEIKPENIAKSLETSEKPKTESLLETGEKRPRVVVTDNLTNANLQCSLAVSQERVSIVNGGGMIGILVGYESGSGDRAKITAVSNRPSDVLVELDPEVGKQTNQAFFVVKSLTARTGIFTVTFDSPCGKKEVQVKVR